MKLTMLGTGNALSTEYYNSSFILDENGNYLLVDGGGGSTLLSRLKYAGYQWKDIKTVFVTDGNVNHSLGVIYLMKLVAHACLEDCYMGELTIYAGKDTAEVLKDAAKAILPKKENAFVGKKIIFIPMKNGDARRVYGHYVTFFDTGSRDIQKFGFTMTLTGDSKLTYTGEMPYNASEENFVIGSDWLVHSAYCLDSEAAVANPKAQGLCTVKEACGFAELLKVKNLILTNTDDEHKEDRKQVFTDEADQYFHGNVYVPDELESIKID